MTSKVISPLSPGVDGSHPDLNLTRERLKQNINITHHSPPHNENLRNHLKTLVSGETKEKEECTRSSKPAALTSLKALLVMGD